MSFRIGFGVDFHQLTEHRPLWVGGIHIPHSKGALGHSDADVLLHAICDALLGAAALGDIGTHFPDTSGEFKNIDSKILLQKTVRLIGEAGYKIINIDSTICLEKPKVKPYILQMQQVIANILSIDANAVSIKATTTEKMGFIGREEGIAAYANALITPLNS
ncbi:MAG TPA: 2-C-methyl-D-erythritol 2,4-cyclodiphosphate synthase [Chitinophagaceae bacterium]|nr:2-C-methyl-D-erythritol 2,4-cyclodiphosphate synthase [Chitinophagaceae bacterium]